MRPFKNQGSQFLKYVESNNSKNWFFIPHFYLWFYNLNALSVAPWLATTICQVSQAYNKGGCIFGICLFVISKTILHKIALKYVHSLTSQREVLWIFKKKFLVSCSHVRSHDPDTLSICFSQILKYFWGWYSALGKLLECSLTFQEQLF